ncbi:MAG: tetratricopeptide repeat protein [Oligoflexales bacterium]
MIDVLNLLKKQPSLYLLEDEQFCRYQEGLQLLWNQEYSQCLDYVTSFLAEDWENPNVFLWYRLWIEVLSEQKDYDSLKLLKAHLLKRGFEEEEQVSWQALRALVHLELDEWEACELLALCLDKHFECPYSLEFIQRYQLRITSEEEGYYLNLEHSEQELNDYFHWLNLARAYLLCEGEDELVSILKYSSKLFPESPMHDEFFAYLYLDDYRVAEAKTYTNQLKSRFPNNCEYSYLNGYVLRNLKDYKGAIKSFQHVNTLEPKDPDVLAELAYCHFIKSEDDAFSFHWEKASTFYKMAVESYRKSGFPISEVFYKKLEQEKTSKIESRQEAIEASTVQHKFWLVNQSQRRAFELASASEDEVQVLFRPMSTRLSHFDLVFFVVDDPIHDDTWRLKAVYQVAMDPVWHPYEGSQVALNLVKRFDFPILLGQMPLQSKDRRSKKRMDDPTRFGVFELDELAFDAIRESIKEWGSMEIEQDLSAVYGKTS